MPENEQSIEVRRKPRKPVAGPVWHVAMTCVAGLIGWAFIQTQDPVFQVPEEFHIRNMPGDPAGNVADRDMPSLDRFDALIEQQNRVDRKNAAVNFAVLGSALAAALALRAAGGTSVPRRVSVAIPLGLLAGAAAGFLGCLAHQRYVPLGVDMGQPSVFTTMKVQAMLFGSLGAGMGLVMGALSRSVRNVAGGAAAGVLAGALAGMLFTVTCAIILPTANLAPLIPPQLASRLLWISMGVGLLGLIVPVGAAPDDSTARGGSLLLPPDGR